jgi:cellulose synthase/poly-beta-1,6-N-acetylglucosamine synthase-like glycosyltransferase
MSALADWDWVACAQWFFMLYFIGINSGYMMLNLLSLGSLKRYVEMHSLDDLPRSVSGFEPPVSVLVPAYNEEATIAGSVRSMLQLNYPEYEVVVINDGSKDGTMAALQREFALLPFPEAPWQRLPTGAVRGVYRSATHPTLRVIDKDNGGKADALNAGINAARYPLFCGVDADSVLERDSLRRVIEPFLEDPRTIASGGTVRIANGCRVDSGFLAEVGLPRNPLALLQIVEYLRAFLFGRLGWSPLNAVLIISGAFGIFRKEVVVEAGGYRSDTVGEDMELVVRLHRLHRSRGAPYRIVFVPDPICWTEAPESLRVLKNQRVRWQRGLSESLTMNLGLLFHPRGGAAGWLAFPFMAVFEWLGPLIEVGGYVFMISAFLLSAVSAEAFWTFMLVAFGFGLVLSVSSLLLEEISFHIYPKPGQIAVLLLVVVLENFGYRQLNALWRLWGLMLWLFGSEARWGEMTRKASWQTGDSAR